MQIAPNSIAHIEQWRPELSTLSHEGGPISADLRFYAAPPREIGHIISAHSGLSASGWASSRSAAQRVRLFAGFFGAAVGALLGAPFPPSHAVSAIVGAVVGMFIAIRFMAAREKRSDACTFVGEKGIAIAYPPRGGTTRQELLLFDGCQTLQAAFLGRKNGTNYDLKWRNSENRVLFALEGGYYGTADLPDIDSIYHFADAAERAWAVVAMNRARAELAERGVCEIVLQKGLSGDRAAAIRRDRMDIRTDGSVQRIDRGELSGASVEAGYVILTFGANAGSRKRPIYLSYGAIRNARTFLWLLSEVLSVPISW